jgi:hypothetical protein
MQPDIPTITAYIESKEHEQRIETITMDAIEIAKQLERLQLAHQVILEIVERMQYSKDMGWFEPEREASFDAHRLVFEELARGIKEGKDLLANKQD